MKQNKIPRNEYIRKPVGKTNPYKEDTIYTDMGQWKYPGQVTKIPSGDITMQGVPYPVYGQDNLGYSQMMYPGMDYQFPGQYVTEIPMAQDGWESRINNYLGNPLGRAQQMSTTNGKENDALRHAYASMYSSENAGPFIANALGLGHEIMGQPNSMKEHAGDIYNNFVGSMVGALPFVSTSNKEKAIKKLHELGLLSSGTKAYGGDPSLSNIEGHYPFGGMYSKTHTHMKDGGWLDQYQKGGASRADSLALYNNAIMLKDFYDKLKPYYKTPDIDKFYDYDKDDIESGKIQRETLEYPDITEANKNIIRANKDPNISYLSDMITGRIDPNAPLLRYDRRIRPQGTITYLPINPLKDVIASKIKILDTDEPNTKFKKQDLQDMIADYVFGHYNNSPKHKKEYEKFIKDYNISEATIRDLAKKTKDIKSKVPGAATTIPYYDPLAVKPADMLTPEEKILREQKYGKKKSSVKPSMTKDKSGRPVGVIGQTSKMWSKKDVTEEYWNKFIKKYPGAIGLDPNNVDKDSMHSPIYPTPKNKKPEQVITPDYLPMIQTGMPDMLSREPEIIASPTPRPSSTNNRISWRMDPDTRKMVPVYLEGKTQKVKEGKRLYNKNIPSSTAAIPADFIPQFEPDQSKDVVSKQMGGWLDAYDDEYRRGGQRRRRGTSKNIQSSINDIFRRNYDVFGPAGKPRFNPRARYEEGGDLPEAQLGALLKKGAKAALKTAKATANATTKSKEVIKKGYDISKGLAKDLAHSVDKKVVTPIQFRKDIKQIKNKAAKQHEYFQKPEVVKKLQDIGASPTAIKALQTPGQVDVKFIPSIGSHYDPTFDHINIDMRQIKNLGKRFGFTPMQAYEHELGHQMQQRVHLGSPEFQQEYANYKKQLADYNLSKQNEKLSQLDLKRRKNTPDYLLNWNAPVPPRPTSKPTLLDKQASGMLRLRAKDKKLLTTDEKKALHYYHSEYPSEGISKIGYDIEEGVERLPHLREMRQAMIDKGFIEDELTPITEDIVRNFIKENPKNRIAQFMDPNFNTNYKKLVKTFKHLPAVAPIGLGAGYALQEQKMGGWLDKAQDGKEYSDAEANYLNRKAYEESLAQARKDYVNDFVKQGTQDALLNSPFNFIAGITPAGAGIFAAQSALSSVQNLANKEYFDAGLDALFAAPLLKGTKSAAKKAIKNVYKLNPKAEKLKKATSSYRVAGMDAYDDFKKTGSLRSKTPQPPPGSSLLERMKARTTGFPSFQKGYADLRYLPDEGGVIFKTDLPTFKRGEINPVTGSPIKGRHYAHRAIDPKTGATMSNIPGSEVEVFGSTPHWLKGYQKLPKQKMGGWLDKYNNF